MAGLMLVRVAGVVVTIAGIAMIRREREDAADLDRRTRPRIIVIWAAFAVIGAAVSVWAVFAIS